ncbi:hypothetical protein Tco_0089148 [Tanacetum coccineum]
MGWGSYARTPSWNLYGRVLLLIFVVTAISCICAPVCPATIEKFLINVGVGEAVALPAEGTFMLVAPDAFSTMVANLFKTEVSEPKPLNLEFELILEMEEVGLKYLLSFFLCLSAFLPFTLILRYNDWSYLLRSLGVDEGKILFFQDMINLQLYFSVSFLSVLIPSFAP